MGKAKVTFKQINQNMQEYKTDDEHMVSMISFELEIGGQNYSDLSVLLKQTIGSDIDTAPLEVGAPQGYEGAFNHEAFRAEAEKYYRGLIGPEGTGIHIEGGSNIMMYNNIFIQEKVVEIEV
jgi:hypothetical protein